MKQTNLWLFVGPPASGKSTYAKQLQTQLEDCIYISRDEIRFSLLKEGEPQFSHEGMVKVKYFDEIYRATKEHLNVIVDATHLNEASRLQTISKAWRNIISSPIINAVVFRTPLDVCLERNAKRTGFARVPDETIKSMFKDFRHPSKDKRISYNKIIDID